MTEETCCPPFDPALWDGTMHEWHDKLFIKDKVVTLFYMPLNFGGAMKRLDAAVRGANATMPDMMCLSEHTSKWNMNVYLAVDRAIPGADNVTLSGSFFSKVYEGPYKNIGMWYKEFDKTVTERGMDIGPMYMWYTTCPKCAKKYGRNYVVIVGKLNGSAPQT